MNGLAEAAARRRRWTAPRETTNTLQHRVGVAIVTVLPEEHEAVVECLERAGVEPFNKPEEP